MGRHNIYIYVSTYGQLKPVDTCILHTRWLVISAHPNTIFRWVLAISCGSSFSVFPIPYPQKRQRTSRHVGDRIESIPQWWFIRNVFTMSQLFHFTTSWNLKGFHLGHTPSKRGLVSDMEIRSWSFPRETIWFSRPKLFLGELLPFTGLLPTSQIDDKVI